MATDWQILALGDVIDVKHGYAFKGEYFTSKPGPIVMTPGNFHDEGGFKLKSPEKYYGGPVPDGYTLSSGDLLVAMTEQKRGLLGSAALVPGGGTFLHNQRLGLVIERASDVVSRRFLYFTFNAPYVRGQIQATANGAKVRHTSPSRIKEVKVQLPPLVVQRKIASVLAAYDELIGNNLRRIEILEEMAQAVYREWFVNFRFPGHEDVAMVDSPLGPIPEGWEVTAVPEAFQILGGATPSTKRPDFWDGGAINWYTPSDLTRHGQMFIERSGRQITTEGLAGCSATVFPSGSVMMTSRATLGVVAINLEPACTNQGFITCLPNDRVSAAHLYFWIKASLPLIESLASGATFKEITKRAFRQIAFLVPSPVVGQAFASRAEPMLSLIANLIRQNENLRATRDLLLPRLVSGEIDVSDLDIDTGWLAS